MRGIYRAILMTAEKPFHNSTLQKLLAYNLAVYVAITYTYLNIDFAKHFDLPDGTTATPGTIMYYAFLSHANVMAGEIVPKTNFGRQLLAAHIFMTWIGMIMLLVPW